jgi:hypothetical protein
MAQIILFEDVYFHNGHKHVFFAQPNFDHVYNKRVSSLVVLEGNWALYADPNYQTPNPPICGPGLYTHLPAGIEKVSSLQPVDAEPTVSGNPADGHVILYEKAKLHGNHKHVFFQNNNLHSGDQGDLNLGGKVSSLVVLKGNWAFYANPNYDGQYPPILGPGSYRYLPAGIDNDKMTSLQQVDAAPTASGDPADSHVILFIDANFLGAHKHVFQYEDNLNDTTEATEDDGFNDVVSSFVILSGLWVFYSDSGYQNPYPLGSAEGRQFGPAIDGSWVEAIGIKNDDMSSLRSVQ